MSCDVGIIGAGVMGSNLCLNIAEKGFKVAVFNRTFSKAQAFVAAQPEALRANLTCFETMADFVAGLKKPRKALILVPAGAATDAVINQLLELMEKDDIIVDTGNAHYKDQTKRAEKIEAAGKRFLGMGISGGEEGARKGPAFFPGGSLSVWDDIKAIVEAASAKADDGRPCVTMNGKGGAGTCVKMYHNAGEYAILQIWGEVFDVLRASGRTNDEIATILQSYKTRNGGYLDSYMLDISIEAAKARIGNDPAAGYLSDTVKDRIGGKGTGLWSAQEALEVGVPCPSLNAAVISRQLTMYKSERVANAATGISIAVKPTPMTDADVDDLYHAAVLSIIASYAQMFQALRALDAVNDFGINLPATIATFRAGCILKGYLLQPMTEAFEKNADLTNLLAAFPEQLKNGLPGFRKSVARATTESSVALPVLTASLVYINAMFQETLAYGQMVSLQRDVFGRHGFELLGKDGLHNHQWPEMQ